MAGVWVLVVGLSDHVGYFLFETMDTVFGWG